VHVQTSYINKYGRRHFLDYTMSCQRGQLYTKNKHAKELTSLQDKNDSE